jgi:hypothetical protein
VAGVVGGTRAAGAAAAVVAADLGVERVVAGTLGLAELAHAVDADLGAGAGPAWVAAAVVAALLRRLAGLAAAVGQAGVADRELVGAAGVGRRAVDHQPRGRAARRQDVGGRGLAGGGRGAARAGAAGRRAVGDRVEDGVELGQERHRVPGRRRGIQAVDRVGRRAPGRRREAARTRRELQGVGGVGGRVGVGVGYAGDEEGVGAGVAELDGAGQAGPLRATEIAAGAGAAGVAAAVVAALFGRVVVVAGALRRADLLDREAVGAGGVG